jgi:phosphoglycolate phosphatase
MIIKAVIFDLDGTIADFNLDYKSLRADVRSYLLKEGVPPSTIKVNENIFEMLNKTEIFLKNSEKKPASFEEIRKKTLAIAETYELDAAIHTNLLPGTLVTLKALRSMGLKTAICTLNSQRSVEIILNRFRMGDYFDAVVSREKVRKVKPNPEHCETTLKTLDVNAEETIMVGDSVNDICSAKEIKTIAVGLSTGISSRQELINGGANYIITSITDLPVLVEKLNSAGFA